MSRRPSLREFLLDSVPDFLALYAVPTLTLSSSSSRGPAAGLTMIPLPLHQTKFNQIGVIETTPELRAAWPIFYKHLPVTFRMNGAGAKKTKDYIYHCAVPGCAGRIKHYCLTCQVALCFYRSRTDGKNCWLHHHELIFSGRGSELLSLYLQLSRPTHK